MNAELDRFHQTLKDGVEGELESYTDDITKSIVATIWNACDDERGRLLQENEQLRKRLADEERLHGSTIDDRDHFHEMADKLAYAVAPIEVIGEHSSMNCPWENALDLITPMAEVDQLRATVQRARDLAAYWATVDGGEQVAEAISSVLDGTHRPLPISTAGAWKSTEAGGSDGR